MLSHEARELVLWVENTERFWRQMMAIFHLLAKKRDKEIYDPRKAPKAFVGLLEAAAKDYIREFGSPRDQWFKLFTPIDRREAAQELVETFDGWYAVDYQTEKKKKE